MLTIDLTSPLLSLARSFARSLARSLLKTIDTRVVDTRFRARFDGDREQSLVHVAIALCVFGKGKERGRGREDGLIVSGFRDTSYCIPGGEGKVSKGY